MFLTPLLVITGNQVLSETVTLLAVQSASGYSKNAPTVGVDAASCSNELRLRSIGDHPPVGPCNELRLRSIGDRSPVGPYDDLRLCFIGNGYFTGPGNDLLLIDVDADARRIGHGNVAVTDIQVVTHGGNLIGKTIGVRILEKRADRRR